MTLIPIWTGKLTLPTVPMLTLNIGGNRIYQRFALGQTVKASLFDTEIPGYSLIRTELSGPYNEILLRKNKAKRRDVTHGVLVAPDLLSMTDLDEQVQLKWESPNVVTGFCDTPDKVVSSWVDQFRFALDDEASGRGGMRKPQLGALHAISAHYAVGEEFDAATIVLPTGTGKTETMLAAQVYCGFSKILVLVPSEALRAQIAEKFASLGILPETGILPREVARPRVAVIRQGIRSLEDAQRILAEANVIVATPNILQATHETVVDALCEGCTDLMVDEAHHITADTWNGIKTRFAKKRVTQFTATPFRRDGAKIDGKIIFNYKLGDAQKAGYYRPIVLRTVEEYGDEDARDRKIAQKALETLRRDVVDLKHDHILMARAKGKDRAAEIFEIYRSLAPEFNPVLVFSGPGRKAANDAALQSLLNRHESGSRIIVCVDMLGEGYDLPNLKIAALHQNHKSLAVTLQFIGRITRKATQTGDASVIANIADPDAEAKLSDLYAEGADWDQLIRRLSEDRIAEELKLQDVVYSLKQKGNLHSQLSLWNLRPSLSTQIYETKCTDWNPLAYADFLPKGAESWEAVSEKDNLLVAVVYRAAPVKWGDYQEISNHLYDLLIAWWDKENGALFLYCSDYDGLRVEKIVSAITDDETSLFAGPKIFNILNNVELPLVKSLGSSRVGAISFTSYFGPNVTEGLANIEKAESALNNIACLGYENGDRVLWGGAKRKGKVWQQRSGSISEWIEWCQRTWSKVSDASGEESNITKDFLRPVKINTLYEIPAISAQWGEQMQMAQSERFLVSFDATELPLYLTDIDIFEAADGIGIRVCSSDLVSDYVLKISAEIPGGYLYQHLSGPKIAFRRQNGEPFALPEYFIKDPPVVRYADGTHSYNCYHIPVVLNAGSFPREQIETLDWTGIPLNRESMGPDGNQNTIQYRTFDALKAEFDLIINDDGPGEAGDLVCLKDIDEGRIKLVLVHCKNAKGGAVSGDIENFYTLCGQAQKCITVKHEGLVRLYTRLKRRNELWEKSGHTRFLKGDIQRLVYFKEKARRNKLEFEVILVQPGASQKSIGENSLKLLATTELFLKKTTDANFRVILSE